MKHLASSIAITAALVVAAPVWAQTPYPGQEGPEFGQGQAPAANSAMPPTRALTPLTPYPGQEGPEFGQGQAPAH